MFLRAYTKTKDGKPHTYYALVESVRTDAGPRQQIVAYLGELNHDQHRRWQRTVVFHNRQGETQQLRLFPDDSPVALPDDPDVVRIRLSSVGWTNARHFGDVSLARWLWQMLRLDEIVDRHVPQGKHTVGPADIVAIAVINRLCAPCSEFALAEHWSASTALEELLGVPDAEVTKDRLYRTLDALREAKDAIESDLKNQFGRLFHREYDLLLYDLTSTYFEGLAEENELAKRGYSRDHRSDCKQVLVALVVTREGFPLAHFTLAGNTQDVETVEQIVAMVEQRYGRAAGVWVMDRGLVSRAKLTPISEIKIPESAGATVRDRLSPYRGRTLSKGTRTQRLAALAPTAGGRGQTGAACPGELSLGAQSPATSEGTRHPSPPTSRSGRRFEKVGAANRDGTSETARQDFGMRGTTERKISPSAAVSDHHGHAANTRAPQMDLAHRDVQGRAAP